LALRGLEGALTHAAPRVRQEALKALLRAAPPEQARALVIAQLDGDDAAARRVALDHVLATQLHDAVSRLRRLAESPKFDDFEYGDKKRILVALATLDREGARPALIGVFEQRNLLRRQAVEDSRIAA